MQVSVQRLPKSTIKLTVTIPGNNVKEIQEKVLAKIASEAEIDGFRKGKAPLELVKQKLNQQKFDAEVMSELVKTYYPQALAEENLAPIVSPKILIEDYGPEKDFTFTAETALRPQITIGDYKKAIKDSYNAKTAKLEKSRKEEKANAQEQKDKDDLETSEEKKSLQQPYSEGDQSKDSRDQENSSQNDHGREHEREREYDHFHMTPTDIVDAILTVTQVEIPDMVVAQEVDRMLTRLVQQLQPLNLAMESYLKSINKTGDQLRAEYEEIAGKNIASEMALAEIVKKEQIEVNDEEIEATVTAMGDEKLKQRYLENPVEKAYVKAIIAKNKLIWKLISEVEGTLEDSKTPSEGESNGTQRNKEENRSTSGDKKENKDNA